MIQNIRLMDAYAYQLRNHYILWRRCPRAPLAGVNSLCHQLSCPEQICRMTSRRYWQIHRLTRYICSTGCLSSNFVMRVAPRTPGGCAGSILIARFKNHFVCRQIQTDYCRVFAKIRRRWRHRCWPVPFQNFQFLQFLCLLLRANAEIPVPDFLFQ